MAAAEARAAWQRMGNRCFVQEDAKRAPKLACCPTSSSKPQYDLSNGDAANRPDHPVSNSMPPGWNSMNSNLRPDARLWLQLQPIYGNLKDFTCEPRSSQDKEPKYKRGENETPSAKTTGHPLPVGNTAVDFEKRTPFSLEAPQSVLTTFMEHDHEASIEELKAVNSDFQQQIKHKAEDNFYEDEELMDCKDAGQFLKKLDKASFDMETPWVRGEKTEPWWRITDKDALASLVAQKSLEHFENCDLPRPQKVHICKAPTGCIEGFDDYGNFTSSLDEKLHDGMTNPVGAHHSCAFASLDAKQWLACDEGRSIYDYEKHYSGKDPPARKHTLEDDLSKTEMLEALRHSQTRAREADMAAQQAYTEKEHIVKLFFDQASHLFAHKQWLRMLQLESLFLQLKIKEHQISTLFPVLPWMPWKGDQLGNGGHKAGKRRGGKHQKCCIVCKYAVAFTIGLGLVSAGLFLGWTLGWLLPSF